MTLEGALAAWNGGRLDSKKLKEKKMSEDFEARMHTLAEKLRAMLDEELGEGTRLARNPSVRPILNLFGITHANELAGLDEGDLRIVVGLARLPKPPQISTLAQHIRQGRDLAPYVYPKKGNPTEAEHGEERYKVIEAANRRSVEEQLNRNPGWNLHSLSVCSYSATPGTDTRRVVIIAVLERVPSGGLRLGR